MIHVPLQPIRTKHKFKEASAILRGLAQKLGANSKLPTVRELCSGLQISSATLDDVLYDLESKGVIERKRGSGLYVSPRIAQKNIGLVFGNNVFDRGVSPFYSMLIHVSQQRAMTHQEKFSFFLESGSMQASGDLPVHQDLVEAIESGKLHGILLAAISGTAHEDWLYSQGLPVVSFDAIHRRPHVVDIDYRQLVEQGVESLAQQGCQRIGLITLLGYARLRNPARPADEILAYQQALIRLGLPFNPAFIWDFHGEYDENTANETLGYHAAKHLLGRDSSVHLDGLVIVDDMMTRGSLAAMRDLKLTVGRDVKIASHANQDSPVLREHASVLTLIEFSTTQIVEAMFGLLERLMHGTQTDADQLIIVPPQSRSPAVQPVTMQEPR